MLEQPIAVMRPTRAARLPRSMPGGAIFQAKLDGHRVIALISDDGVTLQSRSGRTVTSRFTELLGPLGTLPTDTVLDGEVVAVREGRFDFHALAGNAKSRAAAGVGIAYVAFDILMDRGEDIRDRPLYVRIERLRALLAGAPVGVQLIESTTGPEDAEALMDTLADVGLEGWVVKSAESTYDPSNRLAWRKWRVTDTTDGALIGYVGPAERPSALRVRVEGRDEVATLPLDTVQSRQFVASALEYAGEPFKVEVRIEGAGGRHEVIRFVRVRPPD